MPKNLGFLARKLWALAMRQAPSRIRALEQTRVLGSFSGPRSMSWSARRLNLLSSQMASCSSYLEIGVWMGETLDDVRIPFKWGVDPDPKFQLDQLPQGMRVSKQTSDEFFASLPTNMRFDLVFLDGLHTAEQTYRDFLAVLNHIHSGSVILIDDVLPDDDLSAIPDLNEALSLKVKAGITDGRWHGDVWKIIPTIHKFHPELEFVLIQSSSQGLDNVQAILWQSRPALTTPPVGATQFLKNLHTFRFSDAQGLYGHLFNTEHEKDGINRTIESLRGAATR